MLIRLGIENPYAAFSKRELYDDLARYKKKSFTRMLRKFKLSILGQFFPDYATNTNELASTFKEIAHEQKTIRNMDTRRLSNHDHIVMIGTNWNTSAG